MIKILKIVTIILGLFIVIGIFPVVLNFIFFIRDRDVFLNYELYENRIITIDSLSFYDPEGADVTRIDGYSKELGDYNVTIIFGQVKNSEISEVTGMDKNGKIIRNVWFSEKSKYAYPANKSDKVFPIKTFLFNYIKLPMVWVATILLSTLLYRISKREK